MKLPRFAGRKRAPAAIAAKPEIDQGMEAFMAVKNIIRRAIMTLQTLRDPHRKFQVHSTAWLFPVVNSSGESYGYIQYGFEPTPHDISQMEIVGGWLAWLKRTAGEQELRRLVAWTLGVPTWRLAARERCSDRTIRNRIDRSIASMIKQFASADICVETVEDGETRNPYKMVFDKPTGPHGGPVTLRKVYIYDNGFMLGAKRLRDGREKAEKYL